MGFLHKLWDETLAGPTPDSGLGKLRKYNSMCSPSSGGAPPPLEIPPLLDDQIPISRSITILRSNTSSPRALNTSPDSGSAPNSPSCASSTPTSPFSPNTPGGTFKKLTRKKLTSAVSMHQTEPKSPAGYDWIVLSALDR